MAFNGLWFIIMFYSLPILSFITFLPLFGAFVILLTCGDDEQGSRNSKMVALWTSLITFMLSIVILFNFDKNLNEFQFVEKIQWIPFSNISYHMGLDGISLPFVVLSTFLVPICILSSLYSIKKQVPVFMSLFLILEVLMVGTFCAMDILVFYIFFEAVLIPMFLIIGIWGGKRRVYSAFKFFLYTLLGSVLMLVAIFYLYSKTGTTDIQEITKFNFSYDVQIWLFLAFFASFSVKLPMWPVHTWLPDAHVEAPTAGSVILAGILLKMGGYGFLRFSIPMFTDAAIFFAPYIFILSLIAIIYTSLIALVQDDMKKMIAYSSVAHMGFVTIGAFSFTQEGLSGSVYQMVSHGLISGALFLCVGIIYDRLHTREISAYGGVADVMPKFALFFMFMMLASVGLPGTSGFVGELLVLVGIWKSNPIVAIITATGLILGAIYMLWLYRRVMFGKAVKEEILNLEKMSIREISLFVPISALVLLLGIYAAPILDITNNSINNIFEITEFHKNQNLDSQLAKLKGL